MNESVINALNTYIKGFETDKINNDYALYFPDKQQTKELREANRVILVYDYTFEINVLSQSSPWQRIKITDKTWSNYVMGYAFVNLYDAVTTQLLNRTGYVVKVDDGSTKQLGITETFPVLLPIGYSKITGGVRFVINGKLFWRSRSHRQSDV
jgi:hypothetical protein